ncbi:MAG: DNA-deoxyinosine glycosylase [Clostridia bacterium]|nr:DNA-deoxyinosine glycosylase [Clostridia bacterium]
MKESTRVVHQFGPLVDKNCRVLVLGSLPSVKSREQMFFYGHPQNRFWPLMARLFDEPEPKSTDEKRTLALSHHVALWDVIASCEISGSADSEIRAVIPNDLSPIFEAAPIERVFCNGKTSGAYFARFQGKTLGIEAVTLPSTSPANASWSMERLLEAWRIVALCADK